MTLRTVLNKAKKDIYYRPVDFNRSLALTKFTRKIEKEAKEKGIYFEIISASAIILNLRLPDNILETKKKSLNTYIKFIYGEKLYYIQYDDNPLFETSYIELNQIVDREKGVIQKTGRKRIFHTVEITTLWNYNDGKNIDPLANHLYERFHEPLENEEIKNDKQRTIKWYLEKVVYS